MPPLHINQLPGELILHIFRHIYAGHHGYMYMCLAVRRTCRKWWDLSQDLSLWRDVAPPEHMSDSRLLLLLRPVQQNVEHIDLSRCRELTPQVLVELCKLRMPRLHTVRLQYEWDVSPSSLLDLLEAHPTLHSIYNCPVTNDYTLTPAECEKLLPKLQGVVDSSVQQYNSQCEYLGEALVRPEQTWSHNIREYSCVSADPRYLTAGHLRHLAVALPQLESLTLCVAFLNEHLLLSYFSCHTQRPLKKLTIRTYERVTAQCLTTIAECCPSLQEFILQSDNMGNIESLHITSFVQRCRLLTCFIIAPMNTDNTLQCLSNVYDSNKCLAEIGKACSGLTTFSLTHTNKVTEVGVAQLASHCVTLTCLTLANCAKVGDAALDSLLCCPHLREMMVWNMCSITVSGVCHFLGRAPALKTFFFKPSLCDGSVHCTVQPKGPQHSSILDLHFEGNNTTFIQLVEMCPKLKSLEQICPDEPLSAKQMEHLLSGCSDLESIHVPVSSNKALKVLTKGGHKVNKLWLHTCHSGSVKGLIKVLKHLPVLSTLQVSNITSKKVKDKLEDAAKKFHRGKCFTTCQQWGKKRGFCFYFTPIMLLK